MTGTVTCYRLLKQLLKEEPELMRRVAGDIDDLATRADIPRAELTGILLLINTELQIERLSDNAPTAAVTAP